jgi:long-chain acyl-CoA synthetase
VLLGHPDVADAAVFGIRTTRGREAARWSSRLRAARPEPSAPARALPRLAKYKCPRAIEFRDALPRDPNGKLYKRLLRDPYWEGRDRRI